MKKEKSCRDCLIGKRINVNGDILCRLKGAVSPDYICPKHKPAPGYADQNEDSYQRCFNCEFFKVDGVSPDGCRCIGFCKLFTVRHYNGECRRACSRFSMKQDLDQSKTG